MLSDEVGERRGGPRGGRGGAFRHRARVVVDREDLTSAYDRLVVEVVRLRSGRVVAFFADVPDDSPARCSGPPSSRRCRSRCADRATRLNDGGVGRRVG